MNTIMEVVVVYFVIHRVFMEGLEPIRTASSGSVITFGASQTCNSGPLLNCNIQLAVFACIYLNGDMNTIHMVHLCFIFTV